MLLGLVFLFIVLVMPTGIVPGRKQAADGTAQGIAMTPLISDYALEVTDLTKAFGGGIVTQGVSLAIRPGERRLNHRSKWRRQDHAVSTQINGDMRPISGQIKLFGTDVTYFAPYKRAHFGTVANLPDHYPGSPATRANTTSRSACSVGCRRAGRCGGRCRLTANLATEARRVLDTVGLLHLAATSGVRYCLWRKASG